eukprot:Protomagalhaensia_wolfi_Nauph_80__5246@NODE_564_length_2283_cov_8_808824_g421_i0_p1_GENE_NODE_564_length_2283_cov_8_808824_g421_i0NODE_564_length_2283_cov_8_808824_g421_i0_p1_ORF_typecomplete_len238_score48_93DUF4381/PF14316_6/0_031Membr_traf_MHD/PF10540_9/0_11RadC/PF04002_15/0_38_NODE_564_length_2283_cov_8_808824_g421_i04581171
MIKQLESAMAKKKVFRNELIAHFCRHWGAIKDKKWVRNAFTDLFGSTWELPEMGEQIAIVRDAASCAYALMCTAQTENVWLAALNKKLKASGFPTVSGKGLATLADEAYRLEVVKKIVIASHKSNNTKQSRTTLDFSKIDNSVLRQLIFRFWSQCLTSEEIVVLALLTENSRNEGGLRQQKTDLTVQVTPAMLEACKIMLALKFFQGTDISRNESAPLYLLRELLQETEKRCREADP